MTDSHKRGEITLLLTNNQAEHLLIGCSHMVGKSEVHCNGAENINFFLMVRKTVRWLIIGLECAEKEIELILDNDQIKRE
jgi:hypothetical protein